MTDTNIAYGSPQAVKLQSVGLFASSMQRATLMNRLTGQLSQQADASAKLRLQSSNDLPIVRCRDLEKNAGDEITFDLINPVGGKPVMGGAYAEGRGKAMTFSQDKLRINQTRVPISAGDTMTQQRTPHEMRTLARDQAFGYMKRLEDQLDIVHLAGARGFATGGEWVVPLASDEDFADICVNPVKAPTRNRHFMSTGSGIESIKASGNEITIATTDVMNSDLVDALRTHLDGMSFAPPPVKYMDDQMADDAPFRVLLVSSEQYTSFVQSTNFRTLQSNAMARAQYAKQNPIFSGEAGLWNGILIIKMPKPIRFFAGDSLRWCAATTTETETSTDLVPAAFGTGYAVDRAILLGGQALAEAYGKARQSGVPYFWSEKELDHGDKLEVLIGMICGKSKIRFLMDHGDTQQYTDYGVMAIDTAVKLST
jgi:N4-gp56 family major capsid protein